MNPFLFSALVVAPVALLACSSDDDASATPTPTGTQCTAARDQLLVPVASVSARPVSVVSTAGGVTTIYVDATAGGFDKARSNPRVYIALDGAAMAVSDVEAPTSDAWDLALKRQVIFTNGGDSGIGKGGGVLVEKEFDAVTAADAAGVAPESFFDADCNAKKDAIEDPLTSFSGWYDYDTATNRATARPGVTFVVKSAAGLPYKIAILSYTGKADGTTTAPATGFYLLKVAAL